MCQIILYKTQDDEIITADKIILKDLLKEKGGDSLSIAYVGIDGIVAKESFRVESFDDKFKQMITYINEIGASDKLYMIFSRQTPALEKESSESTISQPYINNNPEHCPKEYANSNMNYAVSVHGTIPNVEAYNVEVDTDVFEKYEFEYAINKFKGSYVAAKLNSNYEFEIVNNGGLGTFIIKNDNQSSIVAMCEYKGVEYLPQYIQGHFKGIFKKASSYINYFPQIVETSSNPVNVILCSGGLDSYCAAIKTAHWYPQIEMHLVYVAWGTLAEYKEIESVYRLQTFLNRICEHKVKVDVIEAKDLFANYFTALGRSTNTVSLLNPKSKGGGIQEAETGSAYVPLRNTFMVNLIAGKYEQTHPDKYVSILLGLNLDDGMATNMLDNTSGWLHLINQTVKLSGSRTRNFSVESPYVNKTKLNMILDVIKCKFRNSNVSSEDIQALLEKSFSCYYPKDGVACGECGSCCLRNSAFNRSKK